jgi:hypothetical protein
MFQNIVNLNESRCSRPEHQRWSLDVPRRCSVLIHQNIAGGKAALACTQLPEGRKAHRPLIHSTIARSFDGL